MLAGLGVALTSRSLGVAVDRRKAAAILGAALLVSSGPYLKNLAVYRNPVWPVPVPGARDLFPWAEDTRAEALKSRPLELPGASGPELFVRSFLEIDVPASYPDRARWVVDQGTDRKGHRLGGFWGPGAVLFPALVLGAAFRLDHRRGRFVALGMAAMLGLVTILPQSHELRYFLFLPLTWAASLGFLYPDLRGRFPRMALAVLVACASVFSYVVWLNRDFLRVERVGYREAAKAMGAEPLWAHLSRNRVTCAVRMSPRSILLTGPTMQEFPVRDAGLEEPVLALESAARVARGNPAAAEAYAVIGAARAALGDDTYALWASGTALNLRSDDPLARRCFAQARARLAQGADPPPQKISEDALLAESRAAFREGKFDDSVEAAARVVRSSPGRAEAWDLVCQASAATGRREDAARTPFGPAASRSSGRPGRPATVKTSVPRSVSRPFRAERRKRAPASG